MMPDRSTVDDRRAEAVDLRKVGRIPVRNLWFLMLYASELVRVDAPAWVALDKDFDELPNLVAELLCWTVDRRLKRNLSLGYESRKEVLHRVRGRIEILETMSRRLLDRGQVACRFDGLTINTPRNRLVRSALESLARIASRIDLRRRCHSLALDFAQLGVTATRPTAVELSTERFGREHADDRSMVALAQLACDLALPTEDAGIDPLYAPKREVTWVRRLFEKAVAGFYMVALRPKGWTVHAGQTLRWPVDGGTDGIAQILPSMITDIILNRTDEGYRTIVDTKFNSILTKGWRREETLRSSHIYQMYAYLR